MEYTKGERAIYCADDYWLVEVKGSSPVCIIGKFITKDDALLDAVAPSLYGALSAVYHDIDLVLAQGGSDELNFMVQQALAKAEGKEV